MMKLGRQAHFFAAFFKQSETDCMPEKMTNVELLREWFPSKVIFLSTVVEEATSKQEVSFLKNRR